MTAKEKIEANGYEDVIIFENPAYDTALIGITHDNRAVYSFEKMVEDLASKGMPEDEAIEFIEFNTIRALPYVENAPIVMYELED